MACPNWKERPSRDQAARADEPSLFVLLEQVLRGDVGKAIGKRAPVIGSHLELVTDIQLRVYRAAYKYFVGCKFELASITDAQFKQANDFLDKIGLPNLSKSQVLFFNIGTAHAECLF